jgi:hypothetical protein
LVLEQVAQLVRVLLFFLDLGLAALGHLLIV